MTMKEITKIVILSLLLISMAAVLYAEVDSHITIINGAYYYDFTETSGDFGIEMFGLVVLYAVIFCAIYNIPTTY